MIMISGSAELNVSSRPELRIAMGAGLREHKYLLACCTSADRNLS
jgi:hypothetical protein